MTQPAPAEVHSSLAFARRRRRLLLGSASLLALGVVVNVDRLWPEERSFQAIATVASDDGPKFAARAEVSAMGEEGTMGKPTAKQKSGLYAMKGPKGVAPQMARPQGGPQDGSHDVWAGLNGTEVGEAFGVGGLGLVGNGRGGGGTGEGTIGLGNTGLIGKGGGGRTGSGYGRGVGVGLGQRGKGVPRQPVVEPEGGTHELPPAGRGETGLTLVADDPRSTFSIDVDTASYSAMRRALQSGRLPEPDAVRVEEFINYFDYDYAAPAGDVPFSVTAEVGECPWNPEHKLVHVGLQGKQIATEELPPRNLVFLVDVSGSMDVHDKLPLVKRSLSQLTEGLRAQDRISLVVYAGAAGVVLPPTSGAEKGAILGALEQLESGGSTNGGAGIELAYAQARDAFMEDGVNRVILASDGDFNVGVSSHDELVKMIERQRRSGIELSVLGYGMGHRDHTMEQLADKGNGNYAYIDGPEEAHKVLVEQAGGTLVTIAKDVKIQVELDPARVLSYRLVGYENRRLAHRDFADDTKDAGEIGAGHGVTAIYEVVPREGVEGPGHWMDLNLRYKQPKGEESSLLTLPVVAEARALSETSEDFRFSAAVASFGMLLRGSEHEGKATWAGVQSLAIESMGDDPSCRRHRFVELVGKAGMLAGDGEVVTEPMRCVVGERVVVEVDEGEVEVERELVPTREVRGVGDFEGGEVEESELEPTPLTTRDVEQWVLEVLRLLPPLLALPLFVMALRRPRRRRA
ncbi:vWA domain-containing protein [Paraliomyxa miuraensis]|uniref:vWA domain-containing protein n=1 Tax=Paraliomyxa miuraensis TaxID=376150 RepID=UPI002256B3E0|nr:VWA domain-containing protein [Paraliomyxa miuraensis]MCX4241334.1 VWA domain-containing protein [Paraliomyxa miuraensis]